MDLELDVNPPPTTTLPILTKNLSSHKINLPINNHIRHKFTIRPIHLGLDVYKETWIRSEQLRKSEHTLPSALTITASRTLSAARPYFLNKVPSPPPVICPPMPTVVHNPAGNPWILLFSAILHRKVSGRKIVSQRFLENVL